MVDHTKQTVWLLRNNGHVLGKQLLLLQQFLSPFSFFISVLVCHYLQTIAGKIEI